MSRRCVLITRGAEELHDLARALAERGLDVVPYAVLRDVACADPAGWEAVARNVGDLRRIAFTSPRAPSALLAAAPSAELAARVAAVPAAVVGEATARAAAAAGFTVAERGTAGGADLAGRIAARCGRGATVLHPCGREHHGDLAAGLEGRDITVVTLVVYAMDATPPSELPPLPDPAATAAVVLTSPRAAEAYVAASGRRLAGVTHLVMGPTTAARARELGLDAVPLRRPTPAAIVEELCQICQ
jgi:uroporphyrinogen-III synthase